MTDLVDHHRADAGQPPLAVGLVVCWHCCIWCVIDSLRQQLTIATLLPVVPWQPRC